ncbi:MAG TPA: hypothetical protein VIF57_15870 [Polyangia bacterium]|jgi:hypothetical protein
MKSLGLLGMTALGLGLGLVVATGAGCTVVAPGNPDAAMTMIIPIPIRPDALPPPKPLEASVLVVANLERSSANLADQYAAVMTGLATYLDSVGLQLENMGLIATYGDQFGPRLLLGRRAGATPSPVLEAAVAQATQSGVNVADYDGLLPFIGSTLGNISDEDLPYALRLLASSGNFDGDGQTSEAANVIGFGRGLNNEPLSPLQGGIDRSALFDRPRDLFIVLYLQPLPRHCAFGSADCMVDGRSPADIFAERRSDDTAAWLNFNGTGILPEQILHVAIATKEGEDLSSFRTRCAKVPGFPQTAFDVIAPSPNAYFGPLTAALNGANHGTGTMGDFCELIGAKPDAALMRLGTSVAGVLGSH